MSQTLTISADLYNRLHLGAQHLGVSVEQLIERLFEEWEHLDSELKRRDEAVGRIVSFRERMREKYGEMPDSAELIRADRER